MEEAILSVSLKDYKRQIDDLRASLLGLEKGSEEYEKIGRTIIQMQNKLNEITAIGKKTNVAAAGSYNAIQKEVRELVKANKELEGGLEENSQAFIENAKRINELNNKLKEADAHMGYFQRNVGSYKDSFMSAFAEMKSGPIGFVNGLKTMGKESEGLITKFGSVKGAIKGVSLEVVGLGKQLWAIVANPVGATIAAIATALMMLMKGLNATEENTNRLNGVLAKFKPMLDLLDRAVQSFASAFLDLVEPIVDVIDKTGILKATFTVAMIPLKALTTGISLLGQGLQKLLGFIQPVIDKIHELSNAFANSKIGQLLGLDEMQQLSKLEDEIAKKRAEYNKNERASIEENAKLEKDAADLRAKAYDRENYSAEERKKYMIQYHKLQQQQLKNQYAIAKQQYEIARLEAEKSGNTAETNKRLAEQRAELIKIKAAMSNETTSMEKELKKINSEITTSNKIRTTSVKTAKAEKDVVEDRLKIEERLLRLRLSNNQGDLKLQAQLIQVQSQQEKRTIQREITNEKEKNDAIYQLNVKLTNDLKKLYEDAMRKIDQTHLDGLKDQLSRLKAFQADYNHVFQQIVDEEERVYSTDWSKKLIDNGAVTSKIATRFNELTGEIEAYQVNAEEYMNKVKRIGNMLVDTYKKADEIAVKTGEDAMDVLKRLRKDVPEADYEFAINFEKMFGVSVGNVAKMYQEFQNQREDNLKKTKEDYNKRNILYQENVLNEKLAYDKSYANSVEYLEKKKDLASQEYQMFIQNQNKLSTETDEEYEQRRIESLERLKQAQQNYYDALYRMAEESLNGENYFKLMSEEEERRHKDAMIEIEKELLEWEKQNQNASDEARLKQRQQFNKKVEAEEKKHNKNMQNIQTQQNKKEQNTWQAWASFSTDAMNGVSSMINNLASYKQQSLEDDIERGEKSREEAEKEFESVKKWQVAAATMNMLSSLVSINASIWDPRNPMLPPMKIALSAIQSAAALTSGLLAIKQIQSTQLNGDTPSVSDEVANNNSASNSVQTVDFSAVSVNPLLDENYDMANVRNVNVVNDATSGGDKRVWILQSDLEDSSKQVQVRQNQTTF